MKITIKKHNKQKQINRINDYLYSLDFNKPIEVSINPEKKKRSTDQNSVYWQWITIICKEQDGATAPTKYDLECKHQTFMELFLSPIGETKSGRKVYSSKGLSTLEFNDYMEKIRMIVIDHLGISLFYPSDGELYDQLLKEYGM